MPILIVDATGVLVFYNEPAEVILAQRFDETGEMPADKWIESFAVTDEERKPIESEQWPLMFAITKRQPISRIIWLRGLDGIWRHVNFTAVPFIGQGGQFLGVQSTFWEIQNEAA